MILGNWIDGADFCYFVFVAFNIWLAMLRRSSMTQMFRDADMETCHWTRS
jgi:hypothetical protein